MSGAGPAPGPRERERTLLVAALVALATSLPFLPGLLAGGAFYFRDLSLQFFPLRRYAVDGLLRGELRYWNPYAHEGVPSSLPPVGYPLDLLQVLRPDEHGFSLLLALHVPLAALAFFALARRLALTPTAAAGGALAYALGGFCLSSLNLYIYLQAMAWAPLAIRALLGSVRGGAGALAGGAALVGLVLSTTGVEVAVQAVLVGGLLAWPSTRREGEPPLRALPSVLRLAGAVLLGGGLAAYVLGPMSALVAESAREPGLTTEVVTSHSIHPVTLLQVVVGGLYGDLGRLADRWWGDNFFPRGFPYFLSLYLGGVVVALAGVGALHGRRDLRGRLALLVLAATLLALGRYVGLDGLVAAVEPLRGFRYPSKAFFTVHLAAALLAALGLDVLGRGERRAAWWTLAVGSLAGGLALLASPLLPAFLPGTFRWLVAGFFPPLTPWPARLDLAGGILRDAATGGAPLAMAGLAGWAVLGRRLDPGRGAALVALLAGGDLLRAGSALNPTVDLRFYEDPPAALGRVPELAGDSRVFSCDPTESAAYRRARAERPGSHSLWSFAILAETLTPDFNLPWGVRTAYSPDRTMLVPVARVLPLEDAACRSLPRIADRLRRSGVSHVLSLDPLDHRDLALRAEVAPGRIRPLVVRVYALREPSPLRAVALEAEAPPAAAAEPTIADGPGAQGSVRVLREGPSDLDVEVETHRPASLVIREGYSPGWSATVNGSPVAVRRADGRHRAVPLPRGRSRVTLAYHPPRLRASVAVSLASLAVVSVLAAMGRRRVAP